jgi:hypothetical protein
MIVWGTRVTNKVVSSGQFYCPRCAQQCAYKLRQPKKWGCIYWIPVFPLQAFEPYVECASCNGNYPVEALRHDRGTAQQQFDAQRELEGNLARMLCEVMALTAGEKNNVSPHVCNLIANAVRHVLKIDMPHDDILAAIAAGPDEPEAVLRNVGQQAAFLTDRGKELVLRAVVVVAPKPLTENKLTLALEIGHRLGLTRERAFATLTEFSAR